MDDEPFAYTVTYLPPDLGRAVSVSGLRKKALMELLIDAGVVLASATQAIRAQLADVEVCAQIDVELGAPVLSVERIVHGADGRPVEYVRTWYRGDRYEYAVNLDVGPGNRGQSLRPAGLAWPRPARRVDRAFACLYRGRLRNDPVGWGRGRGGAGRGRGGARGREAPGARRRPEGTHVRRRPGRTTPAKGNVARGFA